MENKIYDNKFVAEIQKLGYTAQNNYLISMGFTNSQRNLRLLRKYFGNKEKALEELLLEREKKGEVLPPSLKSAQVLPGSKVEIPKLTKSVSGSSAKFKAPHEQNSSSSSHDEEEPEIEPTSVSVLSPVVSWNDCFAVMYLDGNNMLYVNDFIRKLCLSSKKKEAEKALARLCLELAKQKNIKTTKLIYDNTSFIESTTTIAKNNELINFHVCSAAPAFTTSDDALVDWASKQTNPQEVLFVTSDRGLEQRLYSTGAKSVMKTGVWFKLARAILGDQRFNNAIQYN